VRSRIPRITCDPIPDIVNVRNGLLDWRTGLCAAHPEVLTTVQLGVDYDPAADCPAFEQFLHQVVPADVVDTVWELIGYLMYSGNPLHKAVMLTGTGRNGKGTFLRVMVRCSGAANVTGQLCTTWSTPGSRPRRCSGSWPTSPATSTAATSRTPPP
jgi:putative DNA primase/helicase